MLNTKVFTFLALVALSTCNETLASYSVLDLYNGIRNQGGNALPEITAKHLRELEDGTGVYKYCATDFNPGRPRTHILTNVNFNGQATVRWLNEGDFCVILNKNDDTLKLVGTVVPMDTSTHGEVSMFMDLTFSMSVMFDQCYCASNLFPGNTQAPEKPRYGLVENDCTPQNYCDRPEEAENLLFCPKCEQGQCQQANANRAQNGAPKPIWQDWYFYTKVSGFLTGDGVPVFRQIAMNSFGNLNPETTTCELDLENLPLPQFYCSDLDDPNNGYGYGVNAKNQHCGFATWFNCKEDQQFINDGTKKHIADFNFEIEPCPTPAPTTSKPTPPTIPSPTASPTTSEPTTVVPTTTYPTPFPTTPAPTTTYPTPFPTTPAPTGGECPTTKPSCQNFESNEGNNFCSTREDCEKMGPAYIFDTDMMGLGCSGMGGNEEDCGCCRKPPTPAPTISPTTSAPTFPNVCKWFNVTQEFCVNVSGIFCPDEE